MKLKFNQGYIEKIKYITLGFVILYTIYWVFNNLGFIWGSAQGVMAFIIRILSPFLWGLVIAYLMNPIVEYLENVLSKIKLPGNFSSKHIRQTKYIIRGISLIITLLIFVFIIFITIYSVFVMINGSFKHFEMEAFIEEATNYIINYTDNLKNVEKSLENMGISTQIFNIVNNYTNNLSDAARSILENTGAKLTLIGKYIINICFGFVFAFNFIMNKEYFNGIVENMLRLVFVKEARRKDIKEVAHEIHVVFMHFIRGRIIDLTLLSLVTSVALLIIGYDYPVIVGTFSGYTNIIPYLGSYIGIIPPMIISLVNGGWKASLFIGIYILAVQQVYIILVSPKVQGKSIGMHPVFVLLSMFLFGNLFGLIGIILSIPFGGIVRIFIIRWVQIRKERKGVELVAYSKKLDKNVEISHEKE